MKALKIHNLDESLVTNNLLEVFHHVLDVILMQLFPN